MSGLLNKLHPAALKAAMTGGTDGWGRHGSTDHVRYAEPSPETARQKCPCGCGGRKRWRGMANGVCLYSGCEASVRRWERDPRTALQQPHQSTGA